MTPTELSHVIAGNVRAALARHNKSAAYVAARMGVSRAWLTRRLTGRMPWRVDELERAANIIGIPVDDLLTGRESRS